MGEIPAARIVPYMEENLDVKDLYEYCKANLEIQKIPSVIEVADHIEKTYTVRSGGLKMNETARRLREIILKTARMDLTEEAENLFSNPECDLMADFGLDSLLMWNWSWKLRRYLILNLTWRIWISRCCRNIMNC